MKKVISVFLVLATLVCLCAGCGKSSEKTTIYVYNWGFCPTGSNPER